jgi:phenylacetic acid degradation operon negative regulatory protein
LVEVLALFGVEDKAARQAVSRLAAKGWLESERVGRRTRWRLTPWADSLLTRGAERIYGLAKPTTAWDQRWLVLLASVPDSRRSQRADMSVGLRWAGFGSLGQGVWLCPWVDREVEAAQVLEDSGVGDATVFRSTMTNVGDPIVLSQRAWAHDQIAADYERFIDRFSVTSNLEIRDLIELVHEWRRFPLLDPGLPDELLGADWPGGAAAQLFTETRQRLRDAATTSWSEHEQRFGS